MRPHGFQDNCPSSCARPGAPEDEGAIFSRGMQHFRSRANTRRSASGSKRAILGLRLACVWLAWTRRGRRSVLLGVPDRLPRALDAPRTAQAYPQPPRRFMAAWRSSSGGTMQCAKAAQWQNRTQSRRPARLACRSPLRGREPGSPGSHGLIAAAANISAIVANGLRTARARRPRHCPASHLDARPRVANATCQGPEYGPAASVCLGQCGREDLRADARQLRT